MCKFHECESVGWEQPEESCAGDISARAAERCCSEGFGEERGQSTLGRDSGQNKGQEEVVSVYLAGESCKALKLGVAYEPSCKDSLVRSELAMKLAKIFLSAFFSGF